MDRFELLKELGRGSFGTASLVRDGGSGAGGGDAAGSRDGTLRVIKEVNVHAMPAGAMSETQREVDVLKSLSHINIVAYHEAFFEEGRLCIVMEYADGGDLYSAIEQRRSEGRRFAQVEALSILAQCSSALQHIHSKYILHRDLKSRNIFLASGGLSGSSWPVVKIGDFGIARVLEDTAAMARTLIGTASHLPPESCEGKPYGTKADIWSLGVVFYEQLALELPFQAVCIAALVMKICSREPGPLPEGYYSEEARGLCTGMLQKNPECRPSARQILSRPVVRQCCEDLPDVLSPCLGSVIDSAVPFPKNAASSCKKHSATRSLPKVSSVGKRSTMQTSPVKKPSVSVKRHSASVRRTAPEPQAATAKTNRNFLVPLPLPGLEVIETTQRIPLPVLEDGLRFQAVRPVTGPPAHAAARAELRLLERGGARCGRSQGKPAVGGPESQAARRRSCCKLPLVAVGKEKSGPRDQAPCRDLATRRRGPGTTRLRCIAVGDVGRGGLAMDGGFTKQDPFTPRPRGSGCRVARLRLAWSACDEDSSLID